VLTAIRSFFEDRLRPEEAAADGPDPLALASAALMFEIGRADRELDDAERDQLRDLLARRFGLDAAALDEIERLAEAEVEEANDLYQFTQLVNEHYGPAERIEVVRNLWRVAWADGVVDAHEEHLIRRIADLLHVRHRDFIAAKLEVRDAASGDGPAA
jgi:uncharacterized tellurite resistance protein B-like protein